MLSIHLLHQILYLAKKFLLLLFFFNLFFIEKFKLHDVQLQKVNKHLVLQNENLPKDIR